MSDLLVELHHASIHDQWADARIMDEGYTLAYDNGESIEYYQKYIQGHDRIYLVDDQGLMRRIYADSYKFLRLVMDQSE